MTAKEERPSEGGSWLRDPKTGKLTRAPEPKPETPAPDAAEKEQG